jgi:hypothetical protein
MLTRGFIAKVSEEDYERISRLNWFASVGVQVRAARMKNRQIIYMHHEVLIGSRDLVGIGFLEVDHIDGDPLNNTRENLRLVTHQENMLNTARHKERKGYAYNRRANLWSVYLDMPFQKRKYLGYTKTEKEAKERAEEAKRNAYNSNS